MNVLIITACPNGQVTSVLCSRLLQAAAERLGWSTQVEVHDPKAIGSPLSETEIAAAELVLVVKTGELDLQRFVGKRVVQSTPSEALADPRQFLLLAAEQAQVMDKVAPPALAAPSGKPKLVAITACPTGVAHTFMAAEALQQAAEQLGYDLKVETRGSVGARNLLDEASIAAADVVLLATDIEVETERFAGKKVYRCGTGVALKQPKQTLQKALAEGVPLQGAGPSPSGDAGKAANKSGPYKHLLTGVSFMLPMVVAGGLLIALSFVFGIEAFKQEGTLPAALMKIGGEAAFALMIPVLAGYIAYSIADRPGLAPGMIGGMLASALGTGFLGGIIAGFLAGYLALALNRWLRLPQSIEALKPILLIPLLASLVTGLAMIYVIGTPVAGIMAALDTLLKNMGTTNAILLGLLLGGIVVLQQGKLQKAALTGNKSGTKSGPYKHLLTGVSFMLPMVVAGGLLIALSFVFGIEAFKQPDTLPAALMEIGGKAAFALMIPVFAGYIAYSVADRPGLAPGMIGGMLASALGTGFLGGIIAGFLAGYLALALNRWLRLPQSIEALKPILLIPLLASLVTGLAMIYVIGTPVAGIMAALEVFLQNMGTTNAILLGLLLGGMMCVDLGGPINKAAYAFSVGLLASQSYAPMAATMAAGMVPPIGMAIATVLARRKFSQTEREAGKAAGVLGLCFISEGAIPFAAKDPLRVIPASIAGGALTGALSMYFGCKLMAPHGGLFVLLIPNAINHALLYLLAIVAGSLVTGVIYALIKRPEADALAVAAKA